MRHLPPPKPDQGFTRVLRQAPSLQAESSGCQQLFHQRRPGKTGDQGTSQRPVGSLDENPN